MGKREFPSNETIIHNLLTSQVEFYFSDHHLKRDKPLMEKLCTTDNGKQGFIPFDEVCNFPKVAEFQSLSSRAVFQIIFLRHARVKKAGWPFFYLLVHGLRQK